MKKRFPPRLPLEVSSLIQKTSICYRVRVWCRLEVEMWNHFRRDAYHDIRTADEAARKSNETKEPEVHIMGCFCNIFENDTLIWIIVIILLLSILNCSCCG